MLLNHLRNLMTDIFKFNFIIILNFKLVQFLLLDSKSAGATCFFVVIVQS
jgi:hypothetical protein